MISPFDVQVPTGPTVFPPSPTYPPKPPRPSPRLLPPAFAASLSAPDPSARTPSSPPATGGGGGAVGSSLTERLGAEPGLRCKTTDEVGEYKRCADSGKDPPFSVGRSICRGECGRVCSYLSAAMPGPMRRGTVSRTYPALQGLEAWIDTRIYHHLFPAPDDQKVHLGRAGAWLGPALAFALGLGRIVTGDRKGMGILRLAEDSWL